MGIDKAKIVSAAQKHISKGQWDKALREYQKLTEDDPTDVRSQLKVADLLVKCERHKEALICYREVANHYLQDNVYEKAVGVLNQALRLAPEDPTLHADLGEAYYRYGRLKDAVRAYHQALKVYRARDAGPQQRQALERMVVIDPEDFGLRIQLAERYHKDGLDDQAVQMFEHAARRLDEEGRQDEYIQVLERILYLRPAQPALRARLIKLLFERQDFPRALKYLQLAFKEQPTDVETLIMLSTAFERIQKPEQAVMVQRELGKLYMAQRDRARAIAAYEHALRLDSRDLESMAMLGDLYYHTNEPRRSLEHLERAMALLQGARSSSPQATKMAQELPRKIQHIRQRLQVEDSGALTAQDAAPHTGNLRASPGPQTTPTPRPDVLAQVELLDDDLELEIIPQTPQRAPQAAQPVAQRASQAAQPAAPVTGRSPERAPVAQAAQATPRQVPQSAPQHAPQSAPQSAPQRAPQSAPQAWRSPEGMGSPRPHTGAPAGAPTPKASPEPLVELIPEIQDIEFVPEIASPEEDKAIKQTLTETEVFLKYGLYDKATQALTELIARFPSSVSARERLVEVYLKRHQSVLAADQLMEMARLTQGAPTRAKAYLEQAAQLLPQGMGQIQQVARELGLSAWGSPEAELITAELDDMDELDDALGALGAPQRAQTPQPASAPAPIARQPQAHPQAHPQAQAPRSPHELVLEEESSLLIEDDDLLDLDELEDEDAIRDATQPEHPALELSEDRVDEMFDSLFSGLDSVGGLRVSAMGRRTLTELGEMAQVDALIQQGLAREAARQTDSGGHAQIDRGRLAVNGSFGLGGFGANSLSQAFDEGHDFFADALQPHSMAAIDPNASMPGLMAMDTASNTNYELGSAYLDMGLVEEALEEFRQASEDPKSFANAVYGMALCEYRLGRSDTARARLQHLIQQPNLSRQLVKNAQELLGRL